VWRVSRTSRGYSAGTTILRQSLSRSKTPSGSGSARAHRRSRADIRASVNRRAHVQVWRTPATHLRRCLQTLARALPAVRAVPAAPPQQTAPTRCRRGLHQQEQCGRRVPVASYGHEAEPARTSAVGFGDDWITSHIHPAPLLPTHSQMWHVYRHRCLR